MFRLTVADVFVVKGRGLVATGKVESGSVRAGDEVTVDGERTARVTAIEAFHKKLEEAHTGDSVGLLLDDEGVTGGAVLTIDGPLGDPPTAADVADRRAQLEKMREAGLMTDAQIEADLRSR